MPEYNKANRQVCDVDIRILSTMMPFLKFETANTTTAGVSSDSVYAMAKGAKRIAFPNPVNGTMKIEAQVYPFKFFALFSDGVINSNAVFAETNTITATTDGTLSISSANGTIQSGSVFVFPVGSYGDEESMIVGTYASGTFTSNNSNAIVNGSQYEVGYLISRNVGVKRISFNNNQLPRDYFITMKTVDKDENGILTPFIITAYKASVKRDFEVSFSSEGDPASVTMTFDLMEDKNGNVMDMIELTDDVISAVPNELRIALGTSSSNVTIKNANGTVTASIKDSNDSDYSKLTAIISGDNDDLIITCDDDADVGTYTVELTDANSNTTTITVIVYQS